MARLEEWLPRARGRKAPRTHRIRLTGLLCRLNAKSRRQFEFTSTDAGFFSSMRRARPPQTSTMSNECVNSAVLASMIDAEQYLSCDRLIARSTAAGFRFLPDTVK